MDMDGISFPQPFVEKDRATAMDALSISVRIVSWLWEQKMVQTYLLTFCQVAIGLAFVISSGSKVRNIARFQEAIAQFGILPPQIHKLAALLFLGGEVTVVILLVIGDQWLLFGFTLALFLLLIFSIALGSVIRREIKVSCHCFGTSTRPATRIDLWRNGGFLLCSGAGLGAVLWNGGSLRPLGLLEYLFVGVGAATFVILNIELGEVVQLFA